MNTTKTSYGTKKQLAADNPRYLFVEHQIEKGMRFPFIANFRKTASSFLMIYDKYVTVSSLHRDRDCNHRN